MANINQGDTANRTMRITDGGVEYYDLLFSSTVNFAAAANAAIDVSVQIIGRLGTTGPKVSKVIGLWMWGSATTDLVASSAAYTVSVGQIVRAVVANILSLLVTDVNGVLTLSMTATAQTRSVNFLLPDGRIVTSPTLTWT